MFFQRAWVKFLSIPLCPISSIDVFGGTIPSLSRRRLTYGVSLKLCLVLCDQNSFGWSKMILVWPNWFGLDHNDLVTTKMKWSRPKWIGQVQTWFILVENHNLDLTNSFWSWPFHFGHDQIIMVKSKSIWSDQNHFGPTKTVLVT